MGDAVSEGEAIRMSHGINISKNGDGVLDDISDLLDIESELEGELCGQPETSETLKMSCYLMTLVTCTH